jgi:hypothetical protein
MLTHSVTSSARLLRTDLVGLFALLVLIVAFGCGDDKRRGASPADGGSGGPAADAASGSGGSGDNDAGAEASPGGERGSGGSGTGAGGADGGGGIGATGGAAVSGGTGGTTAAFTIAVGPAGGPVMQDSSRWVKVDLTREPSFTGDVEVRLSNPPEGVAGDVLIFTGGLATEAFPLRVGQGVPLGNLALTFTASGGGTTTAAALVRGRLPVRMVVHEEGGVTSRRR